MVAPRNAPAQRQSRSGEAETKPSIWPVSAFFSSTASMPAGSHGTDDTRRATRLMLALALVWLVFLIYPIIALAYEHITPARQLLLLAGGVLFVGLYVWAVSYVPAPYPRWRLAALLLLTVLALVAPLLYGGAWLGGFIYAAVVAGLTLEMRYAVVATVVLVGLSIATGSLAGSSWWQTIAVAALTLLSGVLMLGMRWLIALNGELRAARTEIGRLAATEERLRLSRELHDAAKQQVFATSLEIGAARALLGRDQQGVEAHLREASAAIGQVQIELNAVIHELRSASSAEQSLGAALHDYAAAWSRRSGIVAVLHMDEARECSPGVEQALFRVAQEALTNVAKHSEATQVDVTLACDLDAVMLQIDDNGCGFVPVAVSGKGYGLRNMRERMAVLGGRITVQSQPGGGTHITAICLLSSGSADAGIPQDVRQHA